VRAVLDVNVLISAMLAQGTPREVLRQWRVGAFELVVSARLIEELARALAYSKVRTRGRTDEADRLIGLLRGSATVAQDPDDPPRAISRDPKDDYLVALAASTRSILVTGGADLLELRARIPVMSSREFLERLDT
jgi:putative PIN family toxin of toxin-antitoxin system